MNQDQSTKIVKGESGVNTQAKFVRPELEREFAVGGMQTSQDPEGPSTGEQLVPLAIKRKNLPSPSSELWIGDLTDYRAALRLDREEYASIIFYDYDSSSTARYLFYVIFNDERPHWNLLIRDGVFRCYDLLNTGGEFREISFPGYRIRRDKEFLSRLH